MPAPIARPREAQNKVLGRPRRLSLNAVVEAAIEVGLENLSMSAVAARLGVGVATLYTYVEGLDELVRLVALRQSWRPHLEDTGQHWSAVIGAHMRNVTGLFRTEPQILVQFIQGGIGPDGELEDIGHFLTMMIRRGFTEPEAFRIYRIASQLALGAAASTANIQGLKARGEPRNRAIRRELAERDGIGAPLDACLDAYLEEDCFTRVEDGIAYLVATVAAARGETLPAAPPTTDNGPGEI